MKKIICSIMCMIICIFVFPQNVNAANVTPCDVTFYTKPATPCYSQPDFNSTIVTYLDKFLPVHVTGITDNNFFKVNIGTDVYIPVNFLSETLNNKSEKQLQKEKINDCAEAYKMQLEQLGNLCQDFALVDVTGDGFPELITDNHQIFTAYQKRPILAYYSTYDCTLYYHRKTNTLVGKVIYNDKENWEIYGFSTAVLPSGYFTCVGTNVDPYGSGLDKIKYKLENNEKTRNELFEHLYHILGHSKKCSICDKYY